MKKQIPEIKAKNRFIDCFIESRYSFVICFFFYLPFSVTLPIPIIVSKVVLNKILIFSKLP